MKVKGILFAVVTIMVCAILSACKNAPEAKEVTPEDGAKSIRILNIKSEVNSQIEALAAQYEKEKGVHVEVIGVDAGGGTDSQALLKGYYLADQMPDIIACESSGFSNWEGLLVDMSGQSWAGKTDAAYKDSKYGTLGFPYTTEAIGLAYNANILEKAGVDPAGITGPESMRAAFETLDARKEELGLTAVVGYCAESGSLGWSSGNHLFGSYLDSGLGRDDTTYIDQMNTNGGQMDQDRLKAFAAMMDLFNRYSDPALLVKGTYGDQVKGFASGKYAFITQGSWIGAAMTGDYADAYASAGNFPVGMVPYAFIEGQDTILTSAPSWWAVCKEGDVETAEAFLQWCSEDPGQKILVEQAGFASPFKDCKFVASDPFAPVIAQYIASGKTSNWHWMSLPANLGQNGIAPAFEAYAAGELDADGFVAEVQRIATEWYSKL